MKLELCIPAHNEVSVIAETVRTVAAELATLGNVDWSIVVIDNASTDGTREAVEALGNPRVSVLTVATKGKGAAVVAAAQQSRADVFGFIDADLSVHPRNLKKLLPHLSETAIVIGSRLQQGAEVRRSRIRTYSSILFNMARRLIVGIRVTDTQCGLKVTMSRGREELARCVEEGWFFDVEWLCRADRAGLTIVEVPIVWEEEVYVGRKSKLRVFRDGTQAIAAFLRIRQRMHASSDRP